MKGPLVLLVLLALLGTLDPAANTEAADLSPRAVGHVEEVAAVDPAVAIDVIDEVPPKQEPRRSAPAVFDPTPRVGSSGPQVLEIEQKLSALGYLTGKVDGVFDKATQHGVTAFQKVEGLARSGRGDASTLSKLSGASTPSPRYSTPANHLEVDVARQVVFVVRGGVVTNILPTSTGSNKNFTSEGWTRKAITPNGQFRISRKINGMRVSPLGELYKPSYFNGGIAFHGSGSIPTYPASHGCVRLPMQFADWFFSNASPIGAVVYVYGGPQGPNPQPYIDDKPAPSPTPSPTPSESPTPDPSPSDSGGLVPGSTPTPTSTSKHSS